MSSFPCIFLVCMSLSMVTACHESVLLTSAFALLSLICTLQVGNQDFANYVDSNIGSFTRITNLKDPVPIIPGRSLGFAHPSNEAHITEDSGWKSCPGQDNSDDLCSVGDTPNILVSHESNHRGKHSILFYFTLWLTVGVGPYNGITISCK